MEIVEINFHSGKRINYYACSTLYALITGDLDGLQNLLQFGYNVNEYKMAMYNSNALFSYAPEFDFRCRDLNTLCDLNAKYRASCMITTLRNDYDFPTHLMRKSVVHEVIVFLLKYSVTSDVKIKALMLRGFHLIWRSRSSPYVRMHEILSALQEDWIDEECNARCWETLLTASRKYGELFQEMSEGVLTPRSLKHLSRCVVRGRLMKSSWSFGIPKLKIPENLKSYLRLES